MSKSDRGSAANRLAKCLLRGYHAAMKLIRRGSKEVVKFVTPDGVTCVAATCIPLAALDELERQLLRQRAQRQVAAGALAAIVPTAQAAAASAPPD